MSQAASATPSADTPTVDRFLHGVERHALRMAELALPRREEAFTVLQDAQRAFVRHHQGQTERAWPLLFWREFHAGLDTRTRRRGTMEPVATAADAAFGQLDDAAATARLDAALRDLPPGQRQAFLLRVWEDFDIARTAQAMAVAEDSIKTHLFGALRTLRAQLEPAAVASSARDDGRWILRCRSLLDASARALDGATLARLAQLRQAAIAPPAARPARGGRALAWVGGVAVAAGVALMLSRLLPLSEAPRQPAAPATAAAPPAPPPPSIAPSEDTPLAAPDFDLLVDGEDEALLDALEFHAWLHATAPTAPAAAVPQPATPVVTIAQRWDQLDAARQALLQPWAHDWDRLPDPLRVRLQANAQRWESLGADQRAAVAARLTAWDNASPQHRATLRARHEALQAMPPAERAGVRAAYRAYTALAPARQAELQRKFAAVDPAQRSGFLLGASARETADMARRFFAFVPAEERAATLAMLRDLAPAQRQALGQIARRLGPDERDTLRRELLAATPAGRDALIAQRTR